MAMARVRKGDTVVVIAGKERGKRGKVLRVIRGRPRATSTSTCQEAPAPDQKLRRAASSALWAVHPVNVMLVDPQNDKPTRVGVRSLTDGKKARVAHKSGEFIDKA